jgi:hypothetical protein
VNAVTWAVRAYLGAQAAFWAVIGAVAVRNWRRRGRRKLPGPGQPQPSGIGTGEDTGVMTIDDEYRALLDREGGRG